VQQARFVYLTQRAVDASDEVEVAWVLISANNRPLGRSAISFSSYAECRTAVARLRAGYASLRTTAFPTDTTGEWVWRAMLDEVAIARAPRSYLRVRECEYNLVRFVEAIPQANEMPGALRVGRDARGYRPAAVGREPLGRPAPAAVIPTSRRPR